LINYDTTFNADWTTCWPKPTSCGELWLRWARASVSGRRPLTTARERHAPVGAHRRVRRVDAPPRDARRRLRQRNVPSPRPPLETERPPRTASGATKSAVLAALASGNAMTASEVANATGLGRASVSTTLSKLAKTGEITKATRGYQLAGQSTTEA